MGRAHRLMRDGQDGGVFHVTHRCHNREFLLKFACDRNLYRAKIREHLRKYEVWMLDYCVTSNHGHLLLDAEERLELSAFMREVAGEMGRAYNGRKGRKNAFWGDNYNATLVESGRHLWECLCYIELNMVRCGVVAHPRNWEWVGYHEIMGDRRRYRLIDLERLCWRLGADNIEDVRKNLEASLAERIARDDMKRQPCWTESLAVGSVAFVEKGKPLLLSRRKAEIVETGENVWVLQEVGVPYAPKAGPKIARKAVS